MGDENRPRKEREREEKEKRERRKKVKNKYVKKKSEVTVFLFRGQEGGMRKKKRREEEIVGKNFPLLLPFSPQSLRSLSSSRIVTTMM